MHTGAPTGGVCQDQGVVWRGERPQRWLLPPVRQGGRPRDGIGGGGRSAEGAPLCWKRGGTGFGQVAPRKLPAHGSGCSKLRPANANRLGRAGQPHRPCFRHRRAGGSSASTSRAPRTRMRPTHTEAGEERRRGAAAALQKQESPHAGEAERRPRGNKVPVRQVCLGYYISPSVILSCCSFKGHLWR